MRDFHFSHQTRTRGEQILERLFSILPGFLSWTILISLTLLCIFKPLYGAIAIIALDIFWLMRIFYMTIFLVIAYAVLAVEKETDWIKRCELLEQGEAALAVFRRKLASLAKKRKFRAWLDLKNKERDLKQVLKQKIKIPPFDSIYHVVIIAAAKEGRDILEPTLQGLIKSEFPTARIVPILAVEGRTGPEHTRMAEALCKKYREHFWDCFVTVHPDGITGEARVKGANVTYAAKQAAGFVRDKGIAYENVIVSCFDADTVASTEYFAALTYHFMRHPKRTRASFQPIPVYHNNILEAPAFARVLETGSSFFQLIEATNPEKLVTFSSHSMSFKALVEIGYWPVDMISDDSAIFWKALIYYDGDYRVVPMYVTLSMDVIIAENTWKTMVGIYHQKLRWAWGVENLPVVLRAFIKNGKIPLFQKFRYVIKLLEMHITWATLGFLITFIGWLPAFFAGREFSNSVLYYNSAHITGLIFNLATSTLVVTIILATLMLPKVKSKNPLLKRLIFAAEWLLIPFIFTFLSCLPALDAQTRLARASRLEFRVSAKRKSG